MDKGGKAGKNGGREGEKRGKIFLYNREKLC
jgi:hypothetical protein